MTETGARILEASSLPELLAASFDAFESMRMLARSCEDREPGLFAAFMATADAAVDGREAIAAAPALGPAATEAAPAEPFPAGVGVTEAADSLATLAALLSERLALAAMLTTEPGDRFACQDAAQAAGRIHDLMAGG